MVHFKDSEILSTSRIGNGNHWDVYRAVLKKELSIDDFKLSQFIYKVSKNSSQTSIYDYNIKIYNHIKKTDLPTLAFYLADMYEDKKIIIGEDLCSNGLLFVSPNTVRNTVGKNTAEIKLREQLMSLVTANYKNTGDTKKQMTLQIQNNVENKCDEKISINTEQKLMNNKIVEIINFETFIDRIKFDMEKISHFPINICDDMFFYGCDANKNKTEVNYKIADFDSIWITDELTYSQELVLENTKTMLNSFLEYTRIFVEENQLKEHYKKRLESELEIIQKQLYNSKTVR